MIYGIDISDAQRGEHPDLTHSDFVIIKATEGRTYTNPSMRAQAEWARAHGKVVGFYHFLWPGNIPEQAAFFVAQAASQVGDPLWCDWEPTPGGLATCAEKDHFIRSVQQLRGGHKVGLYCDRERWIHVDNTSFAGDGLWIADPSSKAGHPAIQAPWVIHQYGDAAGIDRDAGIWTSPAALKQWCTGHPGTPAPKPTPPPADPNTYIVLEGDTLSSIAKDHRTTWPVLASINHLANPNLIKPGQKLKLR